MKRHVAFAAALTLLLTVCACTPTARTVPPKQTVSLTAMDTVMTLVAYTDDEGFLPSLQAEITRCEGLFDAGNPASDVAKINAADAPVTVSDETAAVLSAAFEANRLTGGAFDCTVAPVVNLWGFDTGEYAVPGKAEVQNALLFTGSDAITLDGTLVTRAPYASVTLGGIAKGALGDRLMALCDSAQVPAVLSLGGNIVLAGDNPNGGLWSVGVQSPTGSGLALSFSCKGGRSVVTSGGYERYFEYAGKTYHHILDPQTGFPADSDLQSVTVIGTDGAMCDALSTGLFVMGYEKAVAFADKHDDYGYILITADAVYARGVQNVELTEEGRTLITAE